MSGSLQDMVIVTKRVNALVQRVKFYMVNRWRSARAKGYSLERDCVNYYRQQGSFALRINSRAQKGVYRSIDVVAYHNGVFIINQCKRRKKYLGKEERERIMLAATQFNATPLLCWRENGLRFEPIK